MVFSCSVGECDFPRSKRFCLPFESDRFSQKLDEWRRGHARIRELIDEARRARILAREIRARDKTLALQIGDQRMIRIVPPGRTRKAVAHQLKARGERARPDGFLPLPGLRN